MKYFYIFIIFLMTVLSPLTGEDNNLYYSLQDIFSYNADPNTGLTVFPTLEIPLGGKYEGMGTAFAAVSDDLGFLESNPSGSSTLQKTELAFLHHSWIADSNIEGVLYSMRINDLGIGLGGKFLYLPFTAYNDWAERKSKGTISESVATLNVSYNFFSNYYFYGLSVGSNIKVAYRNIPASIYAGQSAFSVMADIGALSRFNFLKFYFARSKNFSIGLVVKNLGPFVQQEPLPTTATAGIAYSPIRPLILAFDFNYPFSFDEQNFPAKKWNLAGGINVNITDFLSLQGGFHLKSDNPSISIGTVLDLKTVSFVTNYNLDLSGRLNPLDKFSIEAKLNLGDMGRAARQAKADELYLSGIEAYAHGNNAEAIKYWEQVLQIDPEYIPARENIQIAKKALELQKQMEEKQRVGE